MRAWDQQDDAVLLCMGDAEAFGVFYARHAEWVLGYLARRVRDPEAAADLTAETFATALARRRQFDPRRGASNNWLFTIAMNKLTDYQRRGAVQDRARRRLGMERLEPTEDELRSIAELPETVGVVRLLNELPEEQRSAVFGRVVQEREYSELAESLGVEEAAVRQRVSRGLKAMRKRMGGSR